MPTVSSTIHHDLDASAIENTERAMLSFFKDNVDSFGFLKRGTCQRYRKKFVSSSYQISQPQLKKLVDTNFCHLKDVMLSSRKINSSVCTNRRKEEVKEKVLKYLTSRIDNTSGRLMRYATTSASQKFKLSLPEIRKMWKAHQKAEKRNSNNTKKEKNTANADMPFTGTEEDVSSTCDSLVTQEDETLGKSSEYSHCVLLRIIRQTAFGFLL